MIANWQWSEAAKRDFPKRKGASGEYLWELSPDTWEFERNWRATGEHLSLTGDYVGLLRGPLTAPAE